jgi:xanthosine phosphorylase
MTSPPSPAHDAAAAIRVRVPRDAQKPRVGLILGSGLGAVAERIRADATIPYGDVPGFPRNTTPGHAGELVIGRLAGVPVACLRGRAHVYEGQPADAMAAPVRALKLLGADILIATNAAGSLRTEVGPGALMLIADHINMQAGNPLVGPNDDRFGPRFPSMRDAYDPALRRRLRRTAARLGFDLPEGVYLAYTGPSFETPAEVRAARILGADAVGMSTVPEVILARHCGLRVAALSIIANLAEGLGHGATPSHEETLRQAAASAARLGDLLEAFLAELDGDDREIGDEP